MNAEHATAEHATAVAGDTRPEGIEGTVSADDVLAELRRRGFQGSVDDRHALMQRDGVRVVVPGGGRALPPRVVRMIEFALAPQLGDRWLTAPPPSPRPPRLGSRAEGGSRTVHVLEAIVSQDRAGEPWCAFLVEDFGVIGFGDRREQALQDLKRAAARYLELDAADIALLTPTVV